MESLFVSASLAEWPKLFPEAHIHAVASHKARIIGHCRFALFHLIKISSYDRNSIDIHGYEHTKTVNPSINGKTLKLSFPIATQAHVHTVTAHKILSHGWDFMNLMRFNGST